MITEGMTVTIEDDASNELRRHAGRKATVKRVIGCWALLLIDEIGVRGCLTDFLQPIVTAESMELRV